MNILGINCFSHDTSACLLQNGEIVAFAEEERFNREKHTKKFPVSAIDYCLESGKISAKDVNFVGFPFRPGIDFFRAMKDLVRYLPHSYRRFLFQPLIDLLLYIKKPYFRLKYAYQNPIYFIDHHLAHAASSFFVSSFNEAAILSVDRGGDYISTLLASGQGNKIYPIRQISSPHSLGEIYAAITSYLGFLPNCDEGKVMGLAPYGSPTYKAKFLNLVSPTEGEFKVNLDYFTYHLKNGWWSRKFIKEFGPPRYKGEELQKRHEDIAFAVQSLTEETALHLGNFLFKQTGARNLCVAGGVGLNSVMNTLLLQKGPFEEIFIQPAANDAGNALGAALFIWHEILGKKKRKPIEHCYFGPEFSVAELKNAIQSHNLEFSLEESPERFAAEALARGKIVGWFQGKAEVGPRALGNRSILANPCQAEMKDIVNLKIKKREPFRPFAPAILEEYASEYIKDYYPSPFMLLVLDVKEEKKKVIPAVCHVDGTARLQTVTKRSNPLFWSLIDEFRKITGVPVVLNTSFNVQGEPIVNTPENAVNCFLKSNIDCLIMGNFAISREESKQFPKAVRSYKNLTV